MSIRYATVLLAALLWPIAARPDAMPDGTTGQPSAPRIVSPDTGATVTNPVIVRFQGGVPPMPMKSAAGGARMSGAMAGAHLHLLIDSKLPAPGQKVPVDARHVHFMGGETQTSLRLPPGRHTLQLLVGGADHMPTNPPIVSQPVTITVK
jgi:hypothetical protein